MTKTSPNNRRIFMLGIGGTGMRGLAYLLHEKGNAVSGSDVSVDALAELTHYDTAIEKDALPLLENADVLIYTDAAPEDHVLRNMARERDIPEMSYQVALGDFAKDYEVIAVAGTHGKSSTSAFLAHIMIEAGLDPTVLIGASCPSLVGKHARLGRGRYFVVEADEYREHFLTLSPTQAIITNVDFDHPDFFDSRKAVLELFEKFEHKVKSEIIREADAEGVPALIPGDHMKHNAALAVAMAQRLGIERTDAIESLHTFPGLGRRFEIVGRRNKTDIISDYGHHPVAITATIAGARHKYPDARIAVIFEAHMIERLLTFFDDLVIALTHADYVLLYPPFIPEGRSSNESVKAIKRLSKSINDAGVSSHILGGEDDLRAGIDDLTAQYGLIIAFTAGRLDAAIRTFVA